MLRNSRQKPQCTIGSGILIGSSILIYHVPSFPILKNRLILIANRLNMLDHSHSLTRPVSQLIAGQWPLAHWPWAINHVFSKAVAPATLLHYHFLANISEGQRAVITLITLNFMITITVIFIVFIVIIIIMITISKVPHCLESTGLTD